MSTVAVMPNAGRYHRFLHVLLMAILVFSAVDLLVFSIAYYTGIIPVYMDTAFTIYLLTKLYVPCAVLFIWLSRMNIITKSGSRIIMCLTRHATYVHAFVLTWQVYGVICRTSF